MCPSFSTHLAFRFRGRGDRPLAFCPDRVIVPDAAGRDGFARYKRWLDPDVPDFYVTMTIFRPG